MTGWQAAGSQAEWRIGCLLPAWPLVGAWFSLIGWLALMLRYYVPVYSTVQCAVHTGIYVHYTAHHLLRIPPH